MSEDAGARRRTALFGWSPSPLAAESRIEQRVDRLLPATGPSLAIYLGAIVVLLLLAPVLPKGWELGADGLAFLAAGSWCAVNFWRCRHAHCLVTGTGWLALSALAFTEAGLGHSIIGGNEQPVFLAVLAAGLLFEVAWARRHGTNAVTTSVSGMPDA